jgi:p-hydroxybenzoate 3-monooxygenase
MDGDGRFEVADIAIQNEDGGRRRVSYTDQSATQELVCDYIAGFDGGHSVSRSSIPRRVMIKYSYEFGYAWLAALVEAPVTGLSVMGVSDHGFAAQITRAPQLEPDFPPMRGRRRP